MYTKEQIQTAETHLRNYIQRNRLATSQCETYLEEYGSIDNVLRTLPDKIQHKIMVPVSSVAFMEGFIDRTNEVTVLLGDNYFVKCSVSHARSILSRRSDATQKKLNELRQEYDLFKSRVGLATELLEVNSDPLRMELDEYEDNLGAFEEDHTPSLKLPGGGTIGNQKNKSSIIEVISETNTEEKDEEQESLLAKRRAKLREMEEQGIEMTDEELAEFLDLPLPDLRMAPEEPSLIHNPSTKKSVRFKNPEEEEGDFQEEDWYAESPSGIVEITEHELPDGTVKSFLTPKSQTKQSNVPTKSILKPTSSSINQQPAYGASDNFNRTSPNPTQLPQIKPKSSISAGRITEIPIQQDPSPSAPQINESENPDEHSSSTGKKPSLFKQRLMSGRP